VNKIVCIGKVWPEPASSAAGSRMMKLLETFHRTGWEVIFCCVSKPTEHSIQPAELPFIFFEIALNDSSFDEFIKSQDPAVVLFDRFTSEEQFGWRVALHCPLAIRVLDTEDLHGLREARRIASGQKREYSQEDLLNDVFKRELASIYRSDLSLIISQFEMDLLTHQIKVDKSLLYYLPFNAHPVSEEKKKQLPLFKERCHFITIGNFLHAPNADAVTYLGKEIWPRIRKKLPDVEMHVYGAYPPEKFLRLTDAKTGFIVKGRAIHAGDEMASHRVCLAPLRFGAGLKGKLLEAMLCGTPSVTTSIGAEGMHNSLPFSGFVENDPEKFVEAAVQLYQNEILWREKQIAGFEIVEQMFNNDFHDHLPSALLALQQKLENHRSKNLIGSMLQHHTIQSTRYMGMWIEEKNKKLQGTNE
jgi:glycosyltransferase involved in cell wall biosynthesis